MHAVCSAPCQVDSEKNKNIISGIPPCCAAGWNFSRGCAMKFHRRHAFESLPVTLVVVKIEITLNCRKLLKVKAVFLRNRGRFESCHTKVIKKNVSDLRFCKLFLRDFEDDIRLTKPVLHILMRAVIVRRNTGVFFKKPRKIRVI